MPERAYQFSPKIMHRAVQKGDVKAARQVYQFARGIVARHLAVDPECPSGRAARGEVVAARVVIEHCALRVDDDPKMKLVIGAAAAVAQAATLPFAPVKLRTMYGSPIGAENLILARAQVMDVLGIIVEAYHAAHGPIDFELRDK